MRYPLFRKVISFFRESDLVDKPMSIRRTKLRDGLDGICEYKNKKFLIRVNRKLSENYSIDVFLHEYAHAVAWGKDDDVHGPNWGKAYSRVYRMFLENFIDSE
jgi:hypothetical protein